MEIPFEIPFSIVEDVSEAKYTRILRPYIEKLIQTDIEKPVHSNPFNRFNVKRDEIREDTLEYWNSDDDDNNDKDDEDEDEVVNSLDDHQSNPKRKHNKKNRKRKRENNQKDLNLKKSHDAQIITSNDHNSSVNYEFNSREIIHIKQQMFLSLQQKSKKSLPSEIGLKDIKTALIQLSGFENPLPSSYFKPISNSKTLYEKISFSKFLSRILDNLFYISLFKENWKQCYKIFSILIKTFKIDIHQIWPLGLFMLNELNIEEFKKFFNVEFIKLNNNNNKNNKSKLPKLSPKLLNELAYLQNPLLVPLLLKKYKYIDSNLIKILQRTVSQKRPTYNIIIKFLKLLMRTSRNQHPLFGAYPEQTYVPNGVVANEEENEEGEDDEIENDTNNQITSNISNDSSDKSNSDLEELHDVSSDSEIEIKSEDTDTELDSNAELDSNTQSKSILNKDKSNKKKHPILIKNKDFNPGIENHIPNQHRYMKFLKRHTTPLHRLGSRTRTPTYTLSYIWILVRTGKLTQVQRALEPLLLVVPTSIDGRIELANLTSRILDISCLVNELNEPNDYNNNNNNSNREDDWEKIKNIETKLIEIEDCWMKWKNQFTTIRKKKKRKGIKQFENYENIEISINNLKKWIEISINKVKDKNLFNNENNINESENESEENDIISDSEIFHTAIEENTNNNINDERDENYLFDDEEIDEKEIEREMARLLSYAEDIDDENESDSYNNLNRAEEFDTANDIDDIDNRREEEKFYNEYNTPLDNNDSDSD